MAAADRQLGAVRKPRHEPAAAAPAEAAHRRLPHQQAAVDAEKAEGREPLGERGDGLGDQMRLAADDEAGIVALGADIVDAVDENALMAEAALDPEIA